MNPASKEFYFQWHFMNACNLRCQHCYQNDYNQVILPLEQNLIIADKIIESLKQWNMAGRISLTGGEPFLSPQLFQILDYIDPFDEIKYINILTNGTCITSEQIKALKKYKKLNQIQISLDGSSSSIHNHIRGEGVFEKVLNTISELKNNGFSIAIMYTLMQQNKKDVLNIIDLAEKYDIDRLTIERVTPCGHSDISSIIPSYELELIYKQIAHRSKSIKTNLTFDCKRPLWINTCTSKSDQLNIGGFCPIGLTSLTILWDGTILPCRRLDIPIGNVFIDGIFKVWYDSNVLWAIRDKRNLQGKCNNCPSISRCGGCRAIAYAVSGNYLGEDIQCWIKR